MFKMYRLTVQDQNDPDSKRQYTCGEKEKDFYLQVFSGHYNIKVEELFYSQEDLEEKSWLFR